MEKDKIRPGDYVKVMVNIFDNINMGDILQIENIYYNGENIYLEFAGIEGKYNSYNFKKVKGDINGKV